MAPAGSSVSLLEWKWKDVRNAEPSPPGDDDGADTLASLAITAYALQRWKAPFQAPLIDLTASKPPAQPFSGLWAVLGLPQIYQSMLFIFHSHSNWKKSNAPTALWSEGDRAVGGQPVRSTKCGGCWRNLLQTGFLFIVGLDFFFFRRERLLGVFCGFGFFLWFGGFFNFIAWTLAQSVGGPNSLSSLHASPRHCKKQFRASQTALTRSIIINKGRIDRLYSVPVCLDVVKT